jgi:hypothetical protein
VPGSAEARGATKADASKIRPYKAALEGHYEAFAGQADLYVYFYEQGLRFLQPGGRLSYVVTNKWMRVDYAERLRALFEQRLG